MRGYAREVAFSKLYQYLITNHFEQDLDQFDQTKLDEQDVEFITNLVTNTLQNKENIDQTIASLSQNFKLERICKPDLAVLELAIAEMTTMDTPMPVVASQAVAIAKKYSTDKSVSFVNGILATFIRNNQ
jgi:N utilization substance protein B